MKLVETVKKWAWQIIAGLFIFLYLGKGCTSSKIKKTDKNIDDVHVVIDSLTTELNLLKGQSFTKSELRDEMEEVMLDFLIYEDDLDKGKISLSQIKNKIKKND